MSKNEMNRLIAQRCECLDVSFAPPTGWDKGEAQWCLWKGESWWPVDDYFTDIAACIRAAESLRNKQADPTDIRIELALVHAHPIEWVANVIDTSSIEGYMVYKGRRSTVAAALAAALVEAVQ